MKIEKKSLATEKSRPSRKPRSDGQKNRQLIIQAATIAFTENGADTSLNDIAKQAGVGPGTLYRHFPHREALLEAVYRAEVEKLAAAAEQMHEELPPTAAIQAWLNLFIEHLATKKIIAAALNGLVGGSQVFEENKSKVLEAVTSLYERAAESGDIRPDTNPLDHIQAIVGVTFFGTSENWKDSAIRLVDTLIRGSRPSNTNL